LINNNIRRDLKHFKHLKNTKEFGKFSQTSQRQKNELEQAEIKEIRQKWRVKWKNTDSQCGTLTVIEKMINNGYIRLTA